MNTKLLYVHYFKKFGHIACFSWGKSPLCCICNAAILTRINIYNTSNILAITTLFTRRGVNGLHQKQHYLHPKETILCDIYHF